MVVMTLKRAPKPTTTAQPTPSGRGVSSPKKEVEFSYCANGGVNDILKKLIKFSKTTKINEIFRCVIFGESLRPLVYFLLRVYATDVHSDSSILTKSKIQILRKFRVNQRKVSKLPSGSNKKTTRRFTTRVYVSKVIKGRDKYSLIIRVYADHT